MADSKVSEEDYKAALATVATAERETLQGVKAVLATAREALATARDDLGGVRNGIPVVSGPASPARTNIDSWYNQIMGFEQQLGYMSQSLDSIMAQYNAPTALGSPTYPTPGVVNP